MSMMKTYENITRRTARDHIIKNERFTVKEECANDYRKDLLPTIPAGTSIIADFAGDFGMYGLAEIDGVLHKIKVELHELHKIDFGKFDARNEGYSEADVPAAYVCEDVEEENQSYDVYD